MKIQWHVKYQLFGEGRWEISEKKFIQVHLNQLTERVVRDRTVGYYENLQRFHKRLFK